MDKLIIHPVIPYNGKIGGGSKFNPGKLIIIKAVVPKLTNGFNIKLQSDPKQDSSQEDIALQISVMHLNQCMFLNSFVQGKWGTEVFKSIGTDENFEISLSCEFDKYMVNINDEYLCEYPQTIHYDKISHLNIDGDVSIVQILYESVSVDSHQVVEPVPSFNNWDRNSSPPPSCEITINDSDKLIRYPMEPMVAEYVAAYDAQQIQHNMTGEVSSIPTAIKPKRYYSVLLGVSVCGFFTTIAVIIARIYFRNHLGNSENAISNEHQYI